MKPLVFSTIFLFFFFSSYSQKKESIELTKKETIVIKGVVYEPVINSDSTVISDSLKKFKKQNLLLERKEKPTAIKAKAVLIK